MGKYNTASVNNTHSPREQGLDCPVRRSFSGFPEEIGRVARWPCRLRRRDRTRLSSFAPKSELSLGFVDIRSRERRNRRDKFTILSSAITKEIEFRRFRP